MDSNGAASYLRVSGAAAILRVHPGTVNRWTREGKLPFMLTLGGQHRYPEAEIRALADQLAAPLRVEAQEVEG